MAGNCDSTVATAYKHCGCKRETPRQEELAHFSYAHTLGVVSPATVRYLAALPFSLDVRAHGGHAAGPRLVLVHGTPTLNIVYWTADPSDEFCLEMAAMVGLKAGDAIAFGHTHKLWPRVVEGMYFIYTGGVGRPKDGHWRAGYVRLEPGEAEPRMEFVRITYAVESAARGVIDAGLPEEFAEILRAGGPSERSQ